MDLFSAPAKGRSAEQVVDDLLREKQPDATVAYVLPNATVGYQLGYGGGSRRVPARDQRHRPAQAHRGDGRGQE